MTDILQTHPSVLPLTGGINFRDLGEKSSVMAVLSNPAYSFRSGSLDRINGYRSSASY